MKKLLEYPPTLLNMLVLHETFRRLDFGPEEIFMEPQYDEKREVHFFVVVKAQGKEFRAMAGPMGDKTVDQMYDLWVELATGYNESRFPEEEEDGLYATYWNNIGGLTSLVLAMMNKGFVLPPALTETMSVPLPKSKKTLN